MLGAAYGTILSALCWGIAQLKGIFDICSPLPICCLNPRDTDLSAARSYTHVRLDRMGWAMMMTMLTMLLMAVMTALPSLEAM